MDIINENLDIFQYLRINENVNFDIFERRFPTCGKPRFKRIKKRLKDKERFLSSFEIMKYTEGNYILEFN